MTPNTLITDAIENCIVYVHPTRNGERLVISSSDTGSSRHLDAVALEVIAWQDPTTLVENLDSRTQSGEGQSEQSTSLESATGERGDPVESVDSTNILNEYARVKIDAVHTDTGAELEVTSLLSGGKIRLGEEELKKLSTITPETIYEMLETNPEGPPH